MRDERRRDGKRIPVELDIDLSTYGRYFLSKLTNLSIGGAFVCTKELHPIGTEVTLKFRLPQDDQIIEAQGQVMWTYKQPGEDDLNASGMGIKFTQILQSDRDRIKAFVTQNI